jgi:hypothetical protein
MSTATATLTTQVVGAAIPDEEHVRLQRLGGDMQAYD